MSQPMTMDRPTDRPTETTYTNGTPPVGEALLRVVPLGGLGEIGKNMMLLESGENILIIDAGLAFPSNEMLGIDVIIPDIEYVLERLDWVRGIVLTHGHEDHIGALPYMMEEGVRAPIYATALTRGLLERKLDEHKLLGEADLNTITANDMVMLDPFQVEFFHTCHSFPDSVGVSVKTPVGRVIHTSDYRWDATPVDNKPTEEEKLRQWGDEGVLLLMGDSTNVEQRDPTPSSVIVEGMLEDVMNEAKGRILVATFASNVARVQQVITAARKHGRRVGAIGRSMTNNIDVAMKLGYLDVTEDELLSPKEMENLPDEEVVIVATGSQGEPRSAMVRMSNNDHRLITLRPGDTVVLSASPIPGNEEPFNRTLDNLFRRGVDVRYHELDQVHVSGHGGRADYQRMLEIVRPEFFVPAHGEYRHLVLHKRLANEMGLDDNHAFVLETGQTLEIGRFDESAPEDQLQARRGDNVTAGPVLVDGLGVGDIGPVVLRDRRHLGEDGFLICVVALDEVEGDIIYGPEIISRGFVYMRDSSDLIKRAETTVRKVVKKQMPERVLANKIKDALSEFSYREMGRRPMVLPLVMKV